MKTVVIFCAERTNKQNTHKVIRNLYNNSPVNVIYTGSQAKNRISKLLLPISGRNRNNFNRNLTSLLGSRKADLFVFEGCPLGMIYSNKGGRYAGAGKWVNMNAGKNTINRNVLNVVRKHAKNNATVASPGPFLNFSNRLTLKKSINASWKTFGFKK